jgi:hypothetical protein
MKLLSPEDVVSFCAFSGGMLALHVATSIENFSCAHLPTCPCSRHKALIATLPREALGQMQYLAHLQNHIDSLFSAIAST